MSGYRALAGYGKLKRTTEPAWDLPKNGDVTASPSSIFNSLSTYLDGGKDKWQRFGAGCDFSVTIERNVNFHNDIGMRTYTVATTGMLEPDFTINGFVSADHLDWLLYAFNMESMNTSDSTDTYHYTPPVGPQTFDIGYVQSNNKTNEYAGYDEYHILTGCAIDSVKISYELGSDAGVQFTIEGKALMDWFSLGEDAGDVNTYYEEIPSDVFSTGCVSTKVDGGTYSAIAQTDSAEITIQNFLERRGQCLANWGSGYSMGTLNFEINTTTYSNDPKKYELEMYGYPASDANTSRTFNPKKVPYQIPYLMIETNDSERPGGTYTKAFKLECTKVIATKLDKSYTSENAILDSPSLRGQDLTVTVVRDASSTTDETLYITYKTNGGKWDADAGDRPTSYVISTSATTITLPTGNVISKQGYTFDGWYTDKDLAPAHKITSFQPTSSSASEVYARGLVVYAKWDENSS